MTQATEETRRFYNILVFGIEKRDLTAPTQELRTDNFYLHFDSFYTHQRFNEFDGVILFQGIFEKFERISPFGGTPYLSNTCERNELDKRKKEAQLLLEKGGFICYLLNEPFRDQDSGMDFRGNDLAKYFLNLQNLLRENFSSRFTNLHIVRDEFREFLKIHGAAHTHFRNLYNALEWHVIAKCADNVVGMIIGRSEYFIPALVPDNRPEVVKEYFTLLADAVISTSTKLHQELPNWIEEFKFTEEGDLEAELANLESKKSAISERLDHLRNYKFVLAFAEEDLVASVIKIFGEGLGISVDPDDELREDFKLLDHDGKPICLCEVKGTNKGVKREHINQADNHRERSGLNEHFPSLLIINPNIKATRTLAEKDHEIPLEQIAHAKKMNVLILRTLDLLELLKLHLKNQISRDEVKALLLNNSGWLRVSKDGPVVLTGKETTDSSTDIISAIQ